MTSSAVMAFGCHHSPLPSRILPWVDKRSYQVKNIVFCAPTTDTVGCTEAILLMVSKQLFLDENCHGRVPLLLPTFVMEGSFLFLCFIFWEKKQTNKNAFFQRIFMNMTSCAEQVVITDVQMSALFAMVTLVMALVITLSGMMVMMLSVIATNMMIV